MGIESQAARPSPTLSPPLQPSLGPFVAMKKFLALLLVLALAVQFAA